MTDFMTALALILVKLRTSEHRLKGAQSRLSCDHCRESHKTQVWLCFLILSVLRTSECAPSTDLKEVQKCLMELKPIIERSDALLYAPSYDDIAGHCKNASLMCYLEELFVALSEEDIVGHEDKEKYVECILNFDEKLRSQDSSVLCPPCEAYNVKNTTVFLDRLITLLQSMNMDSNKVI